MAHLSNWRGLVAFCTLCVPLLAHDDDPKLLDRQPSFEGPGWVAGVGQNPVSSQNLGFSSMNVQLQAWLTMSDLGLPNEEGNDCWGYTSPSGREYALIGTTTDTVFVEVTNPASPQVIAHIDGVNSLWRDVKVFGDRAYIVSEGGGGIQVVDLASIDTGSVTLIGATGSGATHNIAIDVDSGYAYRCGGGSNGVRIYDLNANPDNPPFVGSWSNRYCHDAQIRTYTSGPLAGKELCYFSGGLNGGGTDTALTILDVTDKANIIELSTTPYPNREYAHQGWLSEDGQYFYLGDELDEPPLPSTTYVFDVSDPSNVSYVSAFDNGNTAITHNLYVKDGLIFQANYRSGLRVFDASNPTAPVEVAYYDTYPGSDSANFNGLWSVYPYFASGTIIGSDIERGLWVWTMALETLSISIPGGAPTVLDPAGASVPVTITQGSPGDLLAGSEALHYDIGGGFVTTPLVDNGGGNYTATFPAIACGTNVSWYVSAQTPGGSTYTDPAGAPAAAHASLAAVGTTTALAYDMEATSGWTVGFAGDDATTGLWERGDPLGTAAQPEDDHTTGPATDCWFTGQGTGGSVGENDVDGGRTTLVSPVLDLSSATDPSISYWRWYSNDQGGNPGADIFEVFITDDGTSWDVVEAVGPTGAGTTGGWTEYSFRALDIPGLALTAQVQLRFVASDEGGGSIVEAALDDFTVTDVDCGGPAAPIAEFSGTPTSGTAPLAVTFTDQSSGAPTSWSWSFGDGATSTEQHPSHTYGTSGLYTVALTVMGPGGMDTETKVAYVDVSAAVPIAGFGATPTSGVAPLAVVFSDASSGEITSWSWTFGDGATSTQQNPSHTYALSGTYTVALTVTGPGGADTLTRTDYIAAAAAPPSASFSGTPTSGVAPLAVTFSDASSGEISSWSWTFGDGATSTQQDPSHTYASSGSYTVALTVTGPGGADTSTLTDYIDVSAAPPIASFSGSPTSGVAPLAVAFSDESAGEITIWSWAFGDGATSTQQSPSHTYALSGSYTVSLTVTGPGGADTLTRTGYIAVAAAPPSASFSGAPTSGVAPLAVSFSDASAGEIASWSWSFGDGATSTQQDPSHTYALSGTYTVALTVTGPGGSDTQTRTDYIAVAAAPPSASFSGTPTSGVAPLAVAFSDASVGEITSWSWAFGDGATSTQQNPSHTYALSGTYTVSLTVTGPGGADTLTRTDYVTVAAAPPTASFSGTPTSGVAPLAVAFSDASSGEITSWSWTFGDGATSTQQDPSHTYALSGTYTVALTVTGPGGSDTSTRTNYIAVAAAPPSASFSGTPTSGVAPLAVAFSDASSGEITSWSWTFGDGATSTQQDPSHTYALSGTYTVAMTVTGPGGSDTQTNVDYVTVTALPPVAEFAGAPTMGAAPLAVAFTDLSTGEISAWAWDFGDGNVSALESPAHTYALAGSYSVALAVTGPGGVDMETKVDYVLVDPAVIGTNYCPANPNSTGLAATITATGSTLVALNDVTLTAASMPLSQFGYFLASPVQGFIANPGGSAGNLCLAGGSLLGRYADMVQNSGITGVFSISVDLTDVPIAAAPGSTAITAGDTWNFQAWYRDGSTSNFTNGVSILFE